MPAEDHIDGNAAAGTLGQIFSVDITTAALTCDECEHQGPVGELRLYADGPGQVLRCVSCGAVNLRVVERRGQVVLDLRGAMKLVFKISPPDLA